MRNCANEFGRDAGPDHKAAPGNPPAAFACLDGEHVSFDNTASPASGTVLPLIRASGARVD